MGQFGHDSELVSTTAAESVSPGDGAAQGFDQQLQSCLTQRDTLATQIRSTLDGAVFSGNAISDSQAQSMTDQANRLIGNMHTLSQMAVPPSYTVCGTNPAQGRPGPKGDPGAQGPKGDRGPQGPAGPTPRITCRASVRGRTITVTCTQVGQAHGARRARVVRATVAISRGHRVYAYGTGSLRHLVLHSRAHLHGRYVLSIEIRGYRPVTERIRVR